MRKQLFVPRFSRGTKNRKCYLGYTYGCGGPISGEHIVSKNVLEKISANNKTVSISGLSWLPEDGLNERHINDLQAKVLCKDHNSLLSPLDGEAGRLFSALDEVCLGLAGSDPRSCNISINGFYIERWILKTLLGLYHAKQLHLSGGARAKLSEKCLDLLCSPHARWPKNWGLYFIPQGRGLKFSYKMDISLAHLRGSDILSKANININGFEMVFFMGGASERTPFGCFRPSQLVFDRDGLISTLVFNWGKKFGGSALKYTWVGNG